MENIPFIETFSFNDLGGGRTEFRLTRRCVDRSPESLAVFQSIKTEIRAAAASQTPPPIAVALEAGAEVFGLTNGATD